MNFFTDDLNAVSKGESNFKAGFVLEHKSVGYIIEAQVRASVKDKAYRTSMTVDGDGGIREAECECPWGKWLCSHMAASSIYANKHGLSKINLPNAWIARPKKAANFDTNAFDDCFPNPRPTYYATNRPVSQCDKEVLYNQMLEAAVQCPLSWICGPEPPLPEPEGSAPALIDDILEYFISDKEMFLEKCKVSPGKINGLQATRLYNTIPKCGVNTGY